ncbi:uncharacterized protein DMAD_13765 [Drosophila madeirensis]
MAPTTGTYTNKIHYVKKNILEELIKKEYAQVFMQSRDGSNRDIAGLENPMDLGTIIIRVQNLRYRNVDELISDLRLVYKNWFSLKKVHKNLCCPGKQLKKFVENKVSKMPGGQEFAINKDSKMTVKSLQNFPWLQLNCTEPIPTFMPIKVDSPSVRTEPVSAKTKRVAAAKPVVLKTVPVSTNVPVHDQIVPSHFGCAPGIAEHEYDAKPVPTETLYVCMYKKTELVADRTDVETEPYEEDDSLRIITKILGKMQLKHYLQAPEINIDVDTLGNSSNECNSQLWDSGVDDLTSHDLQTVIHIALEHNVPVTMKNGKMDLSVTKFSPKVISILNQALLQRRRNDFEFLQLMTPDELQVMTENLERKMGRLNTLLDMGTKSRHATISISQDLKPSGPAAMAKMARLSDDEEEEK